MDCTVWTTKSCNLNCKYCYERDNKESGNMNLIVEEKVLNNIKKMIIESNENIHNIQFHGGEPLLNFKLIKRFVEEIEKIKGNSIVKYGITTNGTIWNDEISDFFEKYKKSFSGYISISVDGDSKTHNKNRVYKNNEGSFEHVLNSIYYMNLIFKKLRCRVTVEPDTVEDLFENIKYLISLNFKQIAVAFDFFSQKWNENHISIIEEQYNKILKYSKETNSSIEISLVDEIVRESKTLNRCYPNKHFYIDGLIYPCTFVVGINSYNIGNVDDGINYDKIDQIVKISSIDNKTCDECNNKKACSWNRCKLINKVATGDYYTPPIINCVLEHIQIQSRINMKIEG